MTSKRLPRDIRNLILKFGAELDQVSASIRIAGNRLEAIAEQLKAGIVPVVAGKTLSIMSCTVCGEQFQPGDLVTPNGDRTYRHIECSAEQSSANGV